MWKLLPLTWSITKGTIKEKLGHFRVKDSHSITSFWQGVKEEGRNERRKGEREGRRMGGRNEARLLI